MLDTTDRQAVSLLIQDAEHVDVIVPRGGRGLIERISQDARVPVIKHLDGNCHIYVADDADLGMAETLVVNAKTRRFGVCNALESLLVDASVASVLLPRLAAALAPANIEIRGCPRTLNYVTSAIAADESDWSAEYLGPVLSCRVVDGLSDAIDHINQYGSGHTDASSPKASASLARFYVTLIRPASWSMRQPRLPMDLSTDWVPRLVSLPTKSMRVARSDLRV